MMDRRMESRAIGVTIGGTIGMVRLALENLVSIDADFEGGYI